MLKSSKVFPVVDKQPSTGYIVHVAEGVRGMENATRLDSMNQSGHNLTLTITSKVNSRHIVAVLAEVKEVEFLRCQ